MVLLLRARSTLPSGDAERIHHLAACIHSRKRDKFHPATVNCALCPFELDHYVVVAGTVMLKRLVNFDSSQ